MDENKIETAVQPEETEIKEENELPQEETPAQETQEKPQKSTTKEIISWVVTLGAAVLIALVIRTFGFQLVRVDGESMMTTLHDGEIMFTTMFDYKFGTPERFDVVICHYPNRGNTNFVKRVVGLPGDTVQISNGYLYVNGVYYPEEYLTRRPDYSFGPYTVPEGKYFVLGDNRSNSNDSHIIGPLDQSMIFGHAHTVIWPLSEIRGIVQ